MIPTITTLNQTVNGWLVNDSYFVPAIPTHEDMIVVQAYLDGGGSFTAFSHVEYTAYQVKEYIRLGYTEATEKLVAEYPTVERETWRKQEDEARAWQISNLTSTPFIDAALLEYTNTTKATFVTRIIEKADLLGVASATTLGKKNRLDAEIKLVLDDQALPTPTMAESVAIATLEAIVW